jgi:hypothetical protein
MKPRERRRGSLAVCIIYLAAAACLPLVESGTDPTISNP